MRHTSCQIKIGENRLVLVLASHFGSRWDLVIRAPNQEPVLELLSSAAPNVEAHTMSTVLTQEEILEEGG